MENLGKALKEIIAEKVAKDATITALAKLAERFKQKMETLGFEVDLDVYKSFERGGTPSYVDIIVEKEVGDETYYSAFRWVGSGYQTGVSNEFSGHLGEIKAKTFKALLNDRVEGIPEEELRKAITKSLNFKGETVATAETQKYVDNPKSLKEIGDVDSYANVPKYVEEMEAALKSGDKQTIMNAWLGLQQSVQLMGKHIRTVRRT